MTERYCTTCKGLRPVGHERDHALALFGADAPETTESPVDLSPGRVRRDDYATSKEGARSIAYRAGSQKARLLTAYRGAGDLGLTDDEAAARAGLSATTCYWKRCGELRADGAIAATGATRMGAAGVERIVCRIAEEPDG